ncbi:MAG: hypothetical protein KIS87_00755 [Phycisphaeraceae bacterium]|nr:hypothetical protein [Phycisphaeraceae bacterium]
MSENQNNPSQPGLCVSCGKREVRPAVVEYRFKHRLDRREREVFVPDLHVNRCGACGEQYFGNRADAQITEALLRSAGLLTGAEIREACRRIGIRRQSELAELIGVAPESLSRWLRGHVVQSRLADRMLRVFLHVPEARAFLRAMRDRSAGREIRVEQDVPWSTTIVAPVEDVVQASKSATADAAPPPAGLAGNNTYALAA